MVQDFGIHRGKNRRDDLGGPGAEPRKMTTNPLSSNLRSAAFSLSKRQKMNIFEKIESDFHKFLQTNFETPADNRIELTLNTGQTRSGFGDLSTNAALILGKALGKNPREIAEEIVKNFKNDLISTISTAGPGFVNFSLSKEATGILSEELFQGGNDFFSSKQIADWKPEKVSVEFVSANPTGPLHLGHGRGGIIGDVLGNVMSFLGTSATKEFYLNDVGGQIQKLGESLKLRCKELITKKPVELPEDAYHGLYLVEVAEKCVAKHGESVLEKPTEFFADYAKTQMQEMLQSTLSDYGIDFDVWFSEKTLHDSGAVEAAVKKLIDAGHAYEQDDAIWFRSTDFDDDKDRVLRRADGRFTYAAADAAYLLNKIERGFERLIMALGQDHHSYPTRLKGIMKALGVGHIPLDVILYQLVSLKESGKQIRMSKRSGKMVTLREVIDTVGPDVARFFYLNKKADAHLEFDLDLALKKTDENPVYYVQYAFVRIKSILEKASENECLRNITEDDAKKASQSELDLLKRVAALKPLLNNISKNYQTHLLTSYVIDLAKAFHAYYNKNRVVDVENPEISRSRLAVMQILLKTFELCMTLMEVGRPDKM